MLHVQAVSISLARAGCLYIPCTCRLSLYHLHVQAVSISLARAGSLYIPCTCRLSLYPRYLGTSLNDGGAAEGRERDQLRRHVVPARGGRKEGKYIHCRGRKEKEYTRHIHVRIGTRYVHLHGMYMYV
jgi:hypothetical protein